VNAPAALLLRRPVLLAALALIACTPDVVKKAAPPIAILEDKRAPDPSVLSLKKTEEVPVSPELAAENYREILKLAPDDDTKRESMRRLADLSLQIQDAKGDTTGDERGEQSIREAIKLYNELLYSRPEDKANDRVFYQLSRAYQNIGETDAAIETLLKLTERHPDSAFADDAHFRRAELLFSRNKFDEAEAEYVIVMGLEDKTFFEPAQYKLGWARYKQANYEGALEVFLAVLDRELPPGELLDAEAALDGVDPKKGDLARDALRVVCLSLAAMGGGPAINEYLGRKGDPRFYPLLYTALADFMLEKRRYSDAANTYAAFIGRYPKDARAPDFQTRVIGVYAQGGFNDLVLVEKERYATVYDPAAAYWSGQPPREDVLRELRKHFEDLGRHYYAKAQTAGKLPPRSGQPPEEVHFRDTANFLTAGRWFRRLTEVFPTDPQLPEMSFLLAESLLYGGRTLEAAQQFSRTAYELAPGHSRVGDAAYASVLAYQQHAREVPRAQRPDALRLAIGASTTLAERLPQHPEVYRVLTRSAEDLFELRDYDPAVAMAARVIRAPVNVDGQLRRSAWSVTADARFAQKNFAEAETAYVEELKLTPRNSPTYAETVEQVAISIYRQAETARDAGDLRGAARQFLRVGQAVPEARIRATAEYDGAAMLIQAEDWGAAAAVLEGFRRQFPGHALEADVDKKLAVSYQKDNKPVLAAQAYGRVARRPGESPDIRREAAWLAATLFDTGKDLPNALPAYEFYIASFPQPLDRAMDARQRLADVARERGDGATRLRWLRELMAADEGAGPARTARSRAMGATAALEIARVSIDDARAMRLSAPLDRSLPRKRQAMEAAVRDLTRAANYGYAEITTAATFELGRLYQEFARALLDSERPRNLSELALEQYGILLEEQAFPFEEKAIEAYETNLRRIPQGVYDRWVADSARALALLAPAKYGKREKGEDFYATLR
jgi:cellulose synthase operon protein C